MLKLFKLLSCVAVFAIWSLPAAALQLDAVLSWAKRVELGTPVKGVITSISVRAGDRVKKDTLLLQLDQRGYRARVAALAARVKNSKAVLQESKRELDRALELYDRTVLSDHDLQVAKNDFIAAEADYATARAELQQARLELEYSTLRAPFDALVVARHAEVGQSVVPDLKPAILLVLAGAGRMHAVAWLTAPQLAGLKAGMPAEVNVNKQKFSGRILEIGLEAKAKGPAEKPYYRLVVAFDTGGSLLRAGLPAEITLP